MDGLVSILIPAYNAEKWIGDTIKSALAQTWPRIETIVVDDGSCDRTLERARTFESKTVKVITQQNSGASAARNKALSLAQGDFIQWLDADDILAPDKISVQLEEKDRRKEPFTLLSSTFGTFYYRLEKAVFAPSPLWRNLEPVEWLLVKFTRNAWMHPAAWLVSRKLTEAAGPWDERLSLDDDGEYFCRVVAACRAIEFEPQARSYYRQGNLHSMSRGISDKACKSLFLSISLCLHYLLSLETSDRTREACLKYLQTWLIYFYPEKEEILAKIAELAHSLGGQLSPPSLSSKYGFIRRTLGWKAAKTSLFALPRLRMSMEQHWDEALNRLKPAP